MTAYLDSSVILGILLGQKSPPPAWEGHSTLVASVLVEVECLRTLDRIHSSGDLDEKAYLEKCSGLHKFLSAVHLVPLEPPVIRRASGAFPGPLRSLDALHLATAILYQDGNGESLTFLTHDKGLAKVAAAMGLPIGGI